MDMINNCIKIVLAIWKLLISDENMSTISKEPAWE